MVLRGSDGLRPLYCRPAWKTAFHRHDGLAGYTRAAGQPRSCAVCPISARRWAFLPWRCLGRLLGV